MPLTFTLAAPPADRVEAGLLAVPVGAGRALGPGADAVDAALDGELGAFMEEADFDGKPGQTLPVPTRGRLRAAALLVGVGAFDEITTDGIRRGAAAIARRATKAPSVATTLVDLADAAGVERPAAAQALAEGFVLGSYQFLKYKADGDASRLAQVIVVGRASARVEAALERGATVAGAVTWARDMVNEPSGNKSPAAFADAAKKLLRGKGVTVKVMTEAELEAEGLGGVVGVGQGSGNPPRLVKATYTPTGKKSGSVALVGKGVVFDSGGLSLKTSSGMETMKTDMSGAAAVLATMSVLKDLDVKTKVTAYVPMVENMPSGTAIRPGDVLKIRNGKTVEVLNTDAEGRLILADGLALAAEDEPDAVVDVATLTGACMVALGDKIAGLLGNRDSWNEQVRAAADAAGEPVWPLPLPKDYRKLLDSEVADLRNIGTGSYGGAITAALFLSEFVDGVPWVHLDIAGPARAGNDDGYLVKGGTGFAVRTLVELVDRFKKPARSTSAG